MSKLSELILEGCKLAPNQYVSFWSEDGLSACAFGAALLAVQPDSWKSADLADGCWTALDNAVGYKTVNQMAVNPVTGITTTLTTAIFCLNTHWTREQIAEWLKGLGL